MTIAKFLVAAGVLIATTTVTQAQAANQFKVGRDAINSMAGCYLIDYSYVETESLKEGYVKDNRVYDVNKTKSYKEWIYTEEISDNRIRVQHILFGTDLEGNYIEGTTLKHQAEDWEYNAPFLYDFTGPLNWSVKELPTTEGLWTRRITNLDDGLRYQCAASFRVDTKYPEWTCDNYAPIPGRETRDMGRKDYNTLQRSTRVMTYGTSWLERQENIKTIDQNGVRTPLAKEVGKNWYVRLPNSECRPARKFMEERKDFWSLTREAWDEVLIGDRPFVEKAAEPGKSRFMEMMMVEENYYNKNLKNSKVRKEAKEAIVKLINDYRAN